MKKALIVCQGLERERIIAAVSQHSPNKLIVLRSKRDVNLELERSVSRHIETLRKELFPIDSRTRSYPFLLEFDDATKVDFFQLAPAIAEINAKVVLELGQGYKVSADISSGNKIACIALFLVAQLHGLRTTYCSAGRYASMKEEEIEETIPDEIALSVKESYEVPRLPLKLDKIPTDILLKLESMKGRAESIKALAEKVYPEKNIDKQEIVEISRKVELLEVYGYVIRKRISRSVSVEITDAGRYATALRDVVAEK